MSQLSEDRRIELRELKQAQQKARQLRIDHFRSHSVKNRLLELNAKLKESKILQYKPKTAGEIKFQLSLKEANLPQLDRPGQAKQEELRDLRITVVESIFKVTGE